MKNFEKKETNLNQLIAKLANLNTSYSQHNLDNKSIEKERDSIKNEKEDRLASSLSLALDSYLKGASFIRVHDVRSTKNAIDIFKKANCW